MSIFTWKVLVLIEMWHSTCSLFMAVWGALGPARPGTIYLAAPGVTSRPLITALSYTTGRSCSALFFSAVVL